MKKLLIGAGTLVSTIAPVAAVVACGDDTSSKDYSPLYTTLKTTIGGAYTTFASGDISTIKVDKKGTDDYNIVFTLSKDISMPVVTPGASGPITVAKGNSLTLNAKKGAGEDGDPTKGYELTIWQTAHMGEKDPHIDAGALDASSSKQILVDALTAMLNAI